MDISQFAETEDGFVHIPVLYREVLELLKVADGPCRIIDGTLGCGGHSSLILKQNRQAKILGIDRDGDALKRAEKALAFAADRVHLMRGDFSDLADLSTEAGWDSVDAVLLDVGVSSPQIDDASRGFALRLDGPLDMRMDTRSPDTASRLLNRESEQALADIFYRYGEIRASRKLARAIAKRRVEKPFGTTLDFAKFCESVLGKAKPGKLPTPTKCFQALRIAVNDELGELERALERALPLLRKGGRLAVISFHSLEDRIVKTFFRHNAAGCICPPGLPVCVCKHKPVLKEINRKPVTAKPDEIEVNRRAASAKLRVAEKL
ncbi:MAG: 16S rRNA (cytosine(1402)-N(4))-methyltransferase RsmH [Lentisphaerae bacterium]|nr:16S rRNA (cytosine(1402)-N(4))-methyltransferase RsmH [Lentisphaerota bacterium]MCP4099831.1 16S rRNA (cytosine(1402)-N(4))-methyltransferase RsmH [Lentisphaerota bacterium]